jgi:hypothetical protein
VTDRDELGESERRVRDLLRGAADVGPMPDDVVARLDAALEAARPATPVTSLTSRRRSRLPRLLAAAAGIVVIGGGAWFATTQQQHGAQDASTAAAGAEVPSETRILLSGKDYTDVAAVQDLGEETLEDGAADTSAMQAPADDATPGAESLESKPNLLKAPQDDESATSDPSQRPAAEKALACAKQLDVDPDAVVVVEMASYQGEPAAFVVQRTDDGAEVVVVARDCEPGDAALSRVQVPARS